MLQSSHRKELAQLLASIDQLIAEREDKRRRGDLECLLRMAKSLEGLYEMREMVEGRLQEE